MRNKTGNAHGAAIRRAAAAFWLSLALAALALWGSAYAAETGAGKNVARLGLSGKLAIECGGEEFLTLAPIAAGPKWNFVGPEAAEKSPAPETFALRLKLGDGIDGEAAFAGEGAPAGTVDCVWRFRPAAGPVAVNCLGVAVNLPEALFAGCPWKADGAEGAFPQVKGGNPALHNGGGKIAVTANDGRTLTLEAAPGATIAMQDDRHWGGDTFSLRVIMGPGELKEEFTLRLRVGLSGGLAPGFDRPVTLAANDEWVELQPELDVAPGSALDMSALFPPTKPCGAEGRVVVAKDGHFAFAQAPDKPVRFYGANLCFSAQYLPHAEADALLDRWARLGYNTLRIHHYEPELVKKRWSPGFDWDPEQLDRLCYLIAGASKRGIWLTTDLFVSRPVSAAQIGVPAKAPWAKDGGRVPPDVYKGLVLIHEGAYADWQKFARMLLNHVNPYTQRRLADEPALAWICLINEGLLTLEGSLHAIPEWQQKWNEWVKKEFPDRAALKAVLPDLGDDEDPAKGTVRMAGQVFYVSSPRALLGQRFVAATEAAAVKRMRAFLRDELKCQALLTNHNSWPNSVYDQATREELDYVDDHFYVDHQHFLKKSWQLPSQCANRNPVRVAEGGTGSSALRLFGRPFTVSEYNYSGPGRFRGVGAVMTGALAALQDWDVVWRFAYAHAAAPVTTPAPMGYFDLSCDPLNQIADRAAVLLFRRGDLRPAPGAAALDIGAGDLAGKTAPGSPAATGWLAWVTRVGGLLPGAAAPQGRVLRLPAAAWRERAGALAKLRAAGIGGGIGDGLSRSETGEMTLDRVSGVLTVDTPRSGGGYADRGREVAAAKCGVRVSGLSVGATVFVMSLDGKPVKESSRLLVTHLTDLQNTGARYAESARRTLLDWGRLPYLVRDGEAKVSIACAAPGRFSVWALSPGGRRLEKVSATAEGGNLSFTARVRGPQGARLAYEVAEK